MTKSKENFTYLKNAIEYYGNSRVYAQKAEDFKYDQDLGDAQKQLINAHQQIEAALNSIDAKNDSYLRNAIDYYGNALSYRQKVEDFSYNHDLQNANDQVDNSINQLKQALVKYDDHNPEYTISISGDTLVITFT